MRLGFLSILCVWLVLGLTAGASAQQADPSAEQEGKTKFDAGRKALKQGDVKGALALFQASLVLNTTTGTLLNIAYCEEKLGLLASASKHYKAALQLLPEMDESVPIAKARMAAIEPRIPTLRIQVDKRAPPTTTVRLGEQELAAYSLDTDMRLDPGKYAITASAAGHTTKRYEVVLAESQKDTLTVAPLPATSGVISAAPATSGAATAPSPAPPSSPLRTASFVTLGLAGIAVITGAMTGGVAIAKRQELGEKCPGNGPRECDPTLRPLQADGAVLGDISTAMFVIAGTAAAGGTVMLLAASRSSRPKPAVGLSVGPGALLIRGRF
jgi:hypothetical protein